MSKEYIKQFNISQTYIHATAIEKGWWTKRRKLEEAALKHGGIELYEFAKITNQLANTMQVVMELSEGCEFLRNGNPPDDKIPNYSGFEAENADAIVRIKDNAAAYGHNVAAAEVEKVKFNKGRPYMHGKKA